LPSGQKLSLGLLATISLEVVPFRAYALFHALLPSTSRFLDTDICLLLLMWEVPTHASWMSCSVRVFSTDYDPAPITSIVSKWRPFNFNFNRGNRKVWWVEDDSYIVFCKKFPGEKGSVRRCVVVMQQQVLMTPNFGAKSSHILHSRRRTSQ
jgi:hypothetical protein